MPANVKLNVASGRSASWARWLVLAGAVLATKGAIKALTDLVATGTDVSEAQRDAIRELARM